MAVAEPECGRKREKLSVSSTGWSIDIGTKQTWSRSWWVNGLSYAFTGWSIIYLTARPHSGSATAILGVNPQKPSIGSTGPVSRFYTGEVQSGRPDDIVPLVWLYKLLASSLFHVAKHSGTNGKTFWQRAKCSGFRTKSVRDLAQSTTEVGLGRL